MTRVDSNPPTYHPNPHVFSMRSLSSGWDPTSWHFYMESSSPSSQSPASCASLIPPSLKESLVLNPPALLWPCAQDLLHLSSTGQCLCLGFPRQNSWSPTCCLAFSQHHPLHWRCLAVSSKTFPESNCSAAPSRTPPWLRLLAPFLSFHVLPGCLSVAAQLTLNGYLAS